MMVWSGHVQGSGSESEEDDAGPESDDNAGSESDDAGSESDWDCTVTLWPSVFVTQ